MRRLLLTVAAMLALVGCSNTGGPGNTSTYTPSFAATAPAVSHVPSDRQIEQEVTHGLNRKLRHEIAAYGLRFTVNMVLGTLAVNTTINETTGKQAAEKVCLDVLDLDLSGVTDVQVFGVNAKRLARC